MGLLEFSRRHRRWLLLAAAAGICGYGAYKIGSLDAGSSAAASSTETVDLVSSVLNSFLRSNTAEIPTSLKQISKIVCSDEFFGSLSRVSEALIVGIVRGIQSSLVPSESASSSSFSGQSTADSGESRRKWLEASIVNSFCSNT